MSTNNRRRNSRSSTRFNTMAEAMVKAKLATRSSTRKSEAQVNTASLVEDTKATYLGRNKDNVTNELAALWLDQ